MSLLRALGALAVCLACQMVLVRLAPGAHRYVDLMLLPVVWYAIRGSQRRAMLVGCAAGLLEDAWLHIGVFGLNGFKKTLLGWALGGVGARLELNQTHGRFVSGVVLSLADALLDLGLRRLLDLETPAIGPVALVVRALLTGLLVGASFVIVDRIGGEDRFGGTLRRA